MPKRDALPAAKRVILQGIVGYKLFYKKNERSSLFGFIDNDYAWDQDDKEALQGTFLRQVKAVLHGH